MGDVIRIGFGIVLLLIGMGATFLSVCAWVVLLQLAMKGASAAEDAQARGASLGKWWRGERW